MYSLHENSNVTMGVQRATLGVGPVDKTCIRDRLNNHRQRLRHHLAATLAFENNLNGVPNGKDPGNPMAEESFCVEDVLSDIESLFNEIESRLAAISVRI